MCYRGALDLDPEYVHYFYFTDLSGFEVNFKEDIFLLEITPRSNQRDGAEIVQKAEEWLAQQYGFLPGSLPLWRDGCYEPAMSRPPFSEPFPLAKGNVLLVGNAVGLNIPMTGEGIGTAVKSGLLAAEALHKAKDKKRKAADFYPGLCREMLATINGMYPPPGAIRDNLNRGMDGFLEAIKEIYSNSMAIL
jgi:2-polyprenyl-6-methoxyphenol hydroxylase-like FAD-dependent oxidoreductase